MINEPEIASIQVLEFGMLRRTAIRTLSICAFGLSVALCAQAPPASGNAQSTATIYFTITANPAALSLNNSDLTAEIDNKPVAVQSIHPAKNDPLLFIVLMDESTSMLPRADDMKDAALAFFKGLSTEGSRGYLGFFDVTSSFTSRPVTVQEAQQLIARRKIGGGSALYDAIFQGSRSILGSGENSSIPRRLIILITDGDDNQSKTPLNEAIQEAQREGTAIFTLCVDARGSAEQFLREASAKTGGLEVAPRTIADGVAPLLSAIDQQWSAAFLSQLPPDNKLHKLTVRYTKGKLPLSAPSMIPLQ